MSMPMSAALAARGHGLSGAQAQNRYVSFGHFQVDLQREELFKDGARVPIPSKVYQVLLALVERPGEIVTRDDLRARGPQRFSCAEYCLALGLCCLRTGRCK